VYGAHGRRAWCSRAAAVLTGVDDGGAAATGLVLTGSGLGAHRRRAWFSPAAVLMGVRAAARLGMRVGGARAWAWWRPGVHVGGAQVAAWARATAAWTRAMAVAIRFRLSFDWKPPFVFISGSRMEKAGAVCAFI
jgi:hypothetical protein